MERSLENDISVSQLESIKYVLRLLSTSDGWIPRMVNGSGRGITLRVKELRTQLAPPSRLSLAQAKCRSPQLCCSANPMSSNVPRSSAGFWSSLSSRHPTHQNISVPKHTNQQHATNMAPVRPTGVKTTAGGKTSIGGSIGGRGVAGKGLGLGKSGAKRHRYFKSFLATQLDSNNMLTHS